MLLWEVIETAANRKCGAAHRLGYYRMKWDKQQEKLIFQRLDWDAQLWRDCTREEVLAKFPQFGWHTQGNLVV